LAQDTPIHGNSGKASFNPASTMHREEADMFRIVLALVGVPLPAAPGNGQWENQPT